MLCLWSLDATVGSIPSPRPQLLVVIHHHHHHVEVMVEVGHCWPLEFGLIKSLQVRSSVDSQKTE